LPIFVCIQRIKSPCLEHFPKISIVTVNHNNGRYLEQTILSVLNQNYPNLEYIIIDGGSTDNSVEIIKKYEDRLAYWVSEKDQGQYFAVQKGFEKSTGEIMAWINSDDLYVPNSFFAVAEIFNVFPEVDWLMGIPREYNEKGVMMSRITLPWGRWSKHRFYTYDFQFIQQESSFWKRSLWEKAGSKMNTEYKLAGDMELWTRFFRHTKLHTTIATLAGFRYRDEKQRSVEFRQQYLEECEKAITCELKQMSLVKRVGYKALKVLGLFSGPFFFYDVPLFNLIFPALFAIPRPINYDFSQSKYVRKNLLVKLPPLFLFNRQVHRRMFKK
jgi:glycosyltransferase involved in cell wall biosynthesis